MLATALILSKCGMTGLLCMFTSFLLSFQSLLTYLYEKNFEIEMSTVIVMHQAYDEPRILSRRLLYLYKLSLLSILLQDPLQIEVFDQCFRLLLIWEIQFDENLQVRPAWVQER